MNTDRTAIAPLLVEFFPFMEKASSDEWHGFLNAKTGLDIDIAEPNSSAFDSWRQALAAQFDLPVWGYSAARVAAIKARGEELKTLEVARIEAQPQTLLLLAKVAPTKTPADLIRDAKKAIFG